VSRPAASSRCAGFTLVEALLATLLMSVIMAALATVTAQWLPSWDRGIVRLQRIESLALGLDRIVADISSAEFVSVGSSSNAGPIFEGGELSVIFVRTTLSPNAATSLEIVRLGEASDERGRTGVGVAPSTSIFGGTIPLTFSTVENGKGSGRA